MSSILVAACFVATGSVAWAGSGSARRLAADFEQVCLAGKGDLAREKAAAEALGWLPYIPATTKSNAHLGTYIKLIDQTQYMIFLDEASKSDGSGVVVEHRCSVIGHNYPKTLIPFLLKRQDNVPPVSPENGISAWAYWKDLNERSVYLSRVTDAEIDNALSHGDVFRVSIGGFGLGFDVFHRRH